MKQETWQLLEERYREYPESRAEPVPAEEVDQASQQLGISFPSDYREFVQRYGGGMVGHLPIYGLRRVQWMDRTMWSVIDLNRAFREDRWPGVDDWLIISVDQGGNPIGIAPDGSVWVSDHDFGIIDKLADDFESFLRKVCLEIEP